LLGGYDKMKANSSTNIVWENLLGNKGTEHLFEKLTENQVTTLIQNAVTANKMVVLSSLAGDKGGVRMIVDADKPDNFVARSHAYVVQSITDNVVTLYNPWGADPAKVPLSRIKEFFIRAQIK
jgi:hypothetical protein